MMFFLFLVCRNVKLKSARPSRPYVLSPAVRPRQPFHAVSGITETIIAGKLLAVAVGMTTLGAHQSQEVELMQVHLQETRTYKG